MNAIETIIKKQFYVMLLLGIHSNGMAHLSPSLVMDCFWGTKKQPGQNNYEKIEEK